MKLSINLFMTLDGVSQAPGDPKEDTRGGFTRGGWLMSVWDEACQAAVSRWFAHDGPLLLGRRTFDTFASHWSQVTDPDNAVAQRINHEHKFVVTSSGLGASWPDTSTALGDGFLDQIAKLKATESDRELQVHGSVQLARALHQAGLIDVYRFLVAPVVVGPGSGIFNGGGPSYRMNAQHSVVTQNGVFDVEYTPEEFENTKTAAVEDGKNVIVDINK